MSANPIRPAADLENNQDSSRTHGGARKGAGRKVGASTKKTREIADAAAEQGVTPLEVMLEAMRDAYASGGPSAAFGFAKDAAPYLHPRLASTDVNAKVETRSLDQAIAELNAALSNGPTD